MHRVLVLLVLAMVACTQPAAEQSSLATDHCALTEYRQECDVSVGGEDYLPEELQACYRKAETEAVRIAAGIPEGCTEPGAPARLW